MKSDCQVSLGRSASNRVYEERGRFFGVGVTRRCRRRIRQIVAVDGHAIEDFSDLTIAVYARVPGDKLKLEVLREQARQVIDVVLTDRSVLE